MNYLLSSMCTLSFIMLWLNHPLSLGFILIIQTMLTSIIIGYMMSSFFFSYIIIIMMISGMLVLFIYMASVASNEKFKLNIKLMMIIFIMMICTMWMYNNYNVSYYMDFIQKNENICLIKMFNMMTAQMTTIMILYLLMTMIVVPNIAKVNEGPLRMKI